MPHLLTIEIQQTDASSKAIITSRVNILTELTPPEWLAGMLLAIREFENAGVPPPLRHVTLLASWEVYLSEIAPDAASTLRSTLRTGYNPENFARLLAELRTDAEKPRGTW